MNIEITSFSNTFIEYLCGFTCFDADCLMQLMERYFIGATDRGEAIFWHINAENKVTNGHIITMDGETGKVYDGSWYYQDGRPMCLFGAHLLKDYPDKMIALVKEETTAAIMSCLPTPYLWLATGGDILTTDHLLSLEGRTVMMFPDKGEYDGWANAAGAMTGMCVHVSDIMERSRLSFQNVAQAVLNQQPLRPTTEEAVLMRMEAENPCLEQLVNRLDLKVVSVSCAASVRGS